MYKYEDPTPPQPQPQPTPGTQRPKAAFALGIQVALLAADRHASASRSLEFRDNNKAIGRGQETPIVAHALAESKLFLRRLSSVTELTHLIGGPALTDLRQKLLSSELLTVLLNDAKLATGGSSLNFLYNFSDYQGPQTAQGVLSTAICTAGMASYTALLQAEAAQQGRYLTEDKKAKMLLLFVQTMQQLVALLPSLPLERGFNICSSGAARAELEATLLAQEPKLKGGSRSRLQDKAPADKPDADKPDDDMPPAGGAQKRSKSAAIGHGSSPAGKAAPGKRASGRRRKKTPVVEDSEDSEDEEVEEVVPHVRKKTLAQMMAAASKVTDMEQLRMGVGGVALGTPDYSSSGSPSLHTPMNAHQQLSDPTKLRALEDKVSTLSTKLFEAEKEATKERGARIAVEMKLEQAEKSIVDERVLQSPTSRKSQGRARERGKSDGRWRGRPCFLTFADRA